MPLPESDGDLADLRFSAATRELFLWFSGAFSRLFGALLRRLPLSRRADDCRLPPLRFECLAKFIRLRIWSETSACHAAADQLRAGPANGPRKVVELFLQVKDLFLQIHDLACA